MIDGYRSIMINVSSMEKLKVLSELKGQKGMNQTIKYLLGYYEEATGTKLKEGEF